MHYSLGQVVESVSSCVSYTDREITIFKVSCAEIQKCEVVTGCSTVHLNHSMDAYALWW